MSDRSIAVAQVEHNRNPIPDRPMKWGRPRFGRISAGGSSQRFTSGLLRTDAGHRLNTHHRRRVPFAGERLGLRAVETHA
jgi:hypothetical protein